MSLPSVAARLRRPTVVLASIGVVAASFLTTGATVPQVVSTSERVVATPVPIPVFEPLKLAIPKIGVDAPVVPVWTEVDTGRMASPGTATDVGWWAGREAGKGNLLLDGHHDWNGKVGVFYRLPELEEGDEVVVTGKSPKDTLTYRVVWVKNYDRNIDATDLLGNKTGKQMATLITCGGTFDTIARTHRERVVARAELVST
jgi:LPXTG-site transpeptidase (sortase) family protein